MIKKLLVIFILISTSVSSCSLISRKPKTSDVNAFAITCINDNITPSGKPHSESDSYCKKYYYPMVDERGIEFDVVAENRKVMFIEAYIPFLYNKSLYYTTNYKKCVLAYYADEIKDILNEAGISDYEYYKDSIRLTIPADYPLEKAAATVITLDDLLDYNLKTNAYSQQSLGSNQFWNWFDRDDIIVKQMNSNNEQILFESFQFSDNNNNELTYDSLLEALSRE
jgi:hypothetical protein